MRVARFAAVGAANTLMYFLLANALVYIVGLSGDVAAYAAYTMILPVSFVAHRRVTFRSNGDRTTELVRFFLLQAMSLSIIAAVNYVVAGYPSSFAWIGFALISLLIPLANFIVMQFWVFNGSK
nr:GtrA family protein [Rhizobium sp. BK538]